MKIHQIENKECRDSLDSFKILPNMNPIVPSCV